MLANRFAEFFCQKIEAIRNDSFARYTPVANSLGDAQACSAKLSEFERMTEDQVKSLVNSSRLKTCSLDPLPEVLHGRSVARFNQDDQHINRHCYCTGST